MRSDDVVLAKTVPTPCEDVAANASSQSRRPDERGESGFTLIELLVTMTVTVIGLLGLLSLHVTVLKGNVNSARLSEATVIAEQTIEELRSIPFDVLTSADWFDSQPPIDNSTLLPDVEGRVGILFSRRVRMDEVGGEGDLVRIRVTVSWTDDNAISIDGGVPDPNFHAISLELVRTRSESL